MLLASKERGGGGCSHSGSLIMNAHVAVCGSVLARCRGAPFSTTPRGCGEQRPRCCSPRGTTSSTLSSRGSVRLRLAVRAKPLSHRVFLRPRPAPHMLRMPSVQAPYSFEAPPYLHYLFSSPALAPPPPHSVFNALSLCVRIFRRCLRRPSNRSSRRVTRRQPSKRQSATHAWSPSAQRWYPA